MGSPTAYRFRKFLSVVALSFISMTNAAADTPLLFSPVENPDGNPHVRSIIRLADGRMGFATLDGFEIYDGSDFTHHVGVTGQRLELPGYTGFHHLYLSHGDKYLWIKNYNELKCIDLDTELYVTDMESLIAKLGFKSAIDDFFVDNHGRTWAICGDTLKQPDLRLEIKLDSDKGKIIDLATDNQNLYLFSKEGKTFAYSLPSGKFSYAVSAFKAEDEWKFGNTSLVVSAGDGFYQIRNGALGAFFHFDPASGIQTKILESNLRLNTLAVSDSAAFISTNDGILVVNLNSFQAKHLPLIRTKSGNLLASEISTLSIDPENGLWLGMVNRGILYHHPDSYRYLEIPKRHGGKTTGTSLSSVFAEDRDGSIIISQPGDNLRISLPEGTVSPIEPNSSATLTGEYGSGASFISSNGSIFFNEPDKYAVFIRNDSVESPGRAKPVISGIFVNGESIKPLGTYDGNPILNKVASRTSGITLKPDQNFLTFEASLPRYASSPAEFEYMLEGIDRDWQNARGSGKHGRKLSAYYTALPPGEYAFKVRSTKPGNSDTAEIAVTILPHWWQTGWAYAAYALIFIMTVAAIMTTYAIRTKRRIAREQREKYLLARIKNLIEETDRYKTESPEQEKITAGNVRKAESPASGSSSLSEADKTFIAKAVEIVESNLNTPGYSVVQLSRDLCMDRTGLYRKLTSLLEQSPSLFIRDIRLRHAARLLKEQKLSITEIAEKSGFSSTSYMSKCFQERFGCRPSEYAESTNPEPTVE